MYRLNWISKCQWVHVYLSRRRKFGTRPRRGQQQQQQQHECVSFSTESSLSMSAAFNALTIFLHQRQLFWSLSAFNWPRNAQKQCLLQFCSNVSTGARMVDCGLGGHRYRLVSPWLLLICKFFWIFFVSLVGGPFYFHLLTNRQPTADDDGKEFESEQSPQTKLIFLFSAFAVGAPITLAKGHHHPFTYD